MKLIYVVLASVALVSAETPAFLNGLITGELKTVDVLQVIESLTPLVSKFVVDNNLDPYALESIDKEFWVPFPGIPLISFKAQLNLNSGGLEGLSDLKFHKAILTYENRLVKLTVNAEFPLLKVAYNYNLKLRILNPVGLVKADANGVRADAIITFNTTNLMLDFGEFHLQTLDIKNVVIQDKSGWRFWIISLIAEILAKANKDQITKDVETNVADALRRQLNEINRTVPPEVLFQIFEDILLERN